MDDKGGKMTYTITITEPGAEPVIVSLEWTKEAPKEDGFYQVELSDGFIDFVSISIFRDCINICRANGAYDEAAHYDAAEISRWLGPIPLAPGGGKPAQVSGKRHEWDSNNTALGIEYTDKSGGHAPDGEAAANLKRNIDAAQRYIDGGGER